MEKFKFTVISPIYNVGRYLDDYFGSLESQTYGIENLEIILVDDGSTDDSLERCDRFAASHPGSVRVMHQENGGQASARNAGLGVATAAWVTFPDPDDVISPDYFDAIAALMNSAEGKEVQLFAGHIIMWHEADGRQTDNHPTAFRFKLGNSITDLNGKPNFMHGNAAVSFFRRSVLHEHNLMFDARLRARFEDGVFLARYLLVVGNYCLGLVDEAVYFYRQRADGTSTIQTGKVNPATLTATPKYGYLATCEFALAVCGHVPFWLQTFIAYDILWLFKSDAASGAASRLHAPETLSEFHSDLSDVLAFIDPEAFLGFDMMRIPRWMLDALAHGYRGGGHVGELRVGLQDPSRNLIQLRYRYIGERPKENFFVRGVEVQPRYAKDQTHTVLGRVAIIERHVWLSDLGVLRVALDGKYQTIHTGEPSASQYKLRRKEIELAREKARAQVPPGFRKVSGSMRDFMRSSARVWLAGVRRSVRRESISDRFVGVVARTGWARRRYLAAWAFIDKDIDANDSAEELYRWVNANHAEVKTLFVLRRDSTDWSRLRKDGFRLVNYGSFRWKLLMLLADHLISSHADQYVTNPLPAARFGPPQWKFTFLQHGIIKGDLSRWLNGKHIDLFVSSTEPEYHYISGASDYKVSSREVRLTGLPRHDALLSKSMLLGSDAINQILIAPTWRQYLTGRARSRSTDRERNDSFMESLFAQKWAELVSSESLANFARDTGLRIVFMPHPNIQPYLSAFELPSHVEVRQFGIDDVQDVVARSAVMVTDYSSAAFNAAYLERPVVYYQFDQEQYDAEHTEGKGYFDYARDGFGPVVNEMEEVVTSLRRLADDPAYADTFNSRARSAFPVKDGRNSERVYDAIIEMTKPLSFTVGTSRAPLDQWGP